MKSCEVLGQDAGHTAQWSQDGTDERAPQAVCVSLPRTALWEPRDSASWPRKCNRAVGATAQPREAVAGDVARGSRSESLTPVAEEFLKEPAEK